MEFKNIPLDQIRPNPFQPRERFDKESLKELAGSISDASVIQPIIVRPNGQGYQIIAGERRWRAAQMAGLKSIPAIVILESLIENLHRKDLTDIEMENAIHELWAQRELLGFKTKADLARAIGKSTQFVDRHLFAWDVRHEEHIDQYVSTDAIRITRGLEPKERKQVLKKVSEGKIGVREAYTVVRVLKKAPEPLKEAVLEGEVEPEIAEEIMKIKKPEVREQVLEIAKKGVYTPTGLRTRIERLEKPRIELSSAPFNVQLFNKTMWNLDRVGRFDFYTVGYENKTIKQLVELLKRKKVKTLLDVRKNPVSMYKLEFNKENLQKEMEKNDIEYLHVPALGVPSEIRRRLGETGDYDWFFKWYDENVLTNGVLESADFEVLNYPIAIMCVEFDPTRCHRHRIALALEKKGLKGYDL